MTDTAGAGVDDVAGGSLLRQSVRGGLYNVLVRGGADGIRLLSMLVLARLVTPAEFGIVAMVTVVVGIADVIQDLGLSSAAVQRSSLTHEQSSTLFCLNAALGLLGGVVIFASADAVAGFLDDDRVAGVARYLAPMFLISAIGTQPIAMLRRALRFATVAKIGMLGAVVYGGVAIGLAVAGAGAYSLVWALLISNAVTTVVALAVSPFRLARPRFDRSTREMTTFGLNLLGFVVINYVGVNIQTLVIGKADGAAATGLFGRAQRLATASTGFLMAPLTGVAFPIMARLRTDPPRWERYYVQAQAMVVLATMAVAPLLITQSGAIVEVLLGARWVDAGPVLAILGVGVMAQALSSPTGWIYESRGDTNRMLRWGAFGWSVGLIAILAGAPFGIRGVAAGYSVAAVLMIWPCLGYAFRGTGLTVASTLRPLVPIYAAAAAAALGSAAAAAGVPGSSPHAELAVATTVHLASYGLLLVTVAGQRDLLRTIIEQLRPSRSSTDQITLEGHAPPTD